MLDIIVGCVRNCGGLFREVCWLCWDVLRGMLRSVVYFLNKCNGLCYEVWCFVTGIVVCCFRKFCGLC